MRFSLLPPFGSQQHTICRRYGHFSLFTKSCISKNPFALFSQGDGEDGGHRQSRERPGGDQSAGHPPQPREQHDGAVSTGRTRATSLIAWGGRASGPSA